MFFIDKIKIRAKSGKGGNGSISFARDKFTEYGKPDGGHGGNGGNIILQVNQQINTLADFYSSKLYRADDGENGAKGKRHGKHGNNLILYVPQGTQIFNEYMDCMIYDLNENNQTYTLLYGGHGGIGNSSTQNESLMHGKDGEESLFILQLKIICDVTLIGMPNAGKSSYLSASSNAKPKIADYSFTTIHPTLGFIEIETFDGFVMADLPGIISGSYESGHPHTFQHTERSKIFLHIIDITSNDIIRDYNIVKNEIDKYNSYVDKKEFIALNKIDLLSKQEIIEKSAILLEYTGIKPHCISTQTKFGIHDLNHLLYNALHNA